MKHKLRSMVKAPPGYLLMQADFSQGETWIVAHLSGDENLKHFLKTSDVHSETGFAIHYPPNGCLHKWLPNELDGKSCLVCRAILDKEQRTLGKQSNHGLSYRMSYLNWVRLQNKNGIRISNQRGKEIRETWLDLYPGIPKWWSDIEWKLRAFNNTMRTCYGRERTFFSQWGDELFKEATAYEPQSTLADHANGIIHPELGIPGGFLTVHKKLGNGNPLWINNASHDSILMEVPVEAVSEVAPQVREILQRPLVVNGEEFVIPVDIEIGERWSDGMVGWKEAA